MKRENQDEQPSNVVIEPYSAEKVEENISVTQPASVPLDDKIAQIEKELESIASIE